MTDNEIVSVLAYCSDKTGRACFTCPLKDDKGCLETLPRLAFELINRQKEEIDRLIEQNVRLNKECDHYIDFVSTARAEAIKEFAERLKAEGFHHKNFGDLVQFEDIDCLVEEMTEETNNADIDRVV